MSISSPALNIIIKALDKISGKMARDFGEIENLQGNNFAASKFTNACYLAVKKRFIEDLSKINPGYNIKFIDGEEIVNNKKSKASYIIIPIDGMLNLSRSIPRFSNVIALEEEIAGKKEITTLAVNNVAANQLCVAVRGNGAYLNNRRIRISNRKNLGTILCAISKQNLFNDLIDKKKYQLQLSNCPTLDIVDFAASKLDMAIFDKSDAAILNILSLLIKEAGGFINEDKKTYIIKNAVS